MIAGMQTIAVRSSAFADGAPMPEKHSAIGRNVSPALSWDPAPAGTQSIAMLVSDPDAPGGDWLHWLILNLPANTTSLPEGVPGQATLASGAVQCLNDSRRIGYSGPRPPPGKVHHYIFNVYALRCLLPLGPNATKEDFRRLLPDQVVAQGKITGTFKR